MEKLSQRAQRHKLNKWQNQNLRSGLFDFIFQYSLPWIEENVPDIQISLKILKGN